MTIVNHNMNILRNKNKGGFTLIETIVSLAIFSASIVGLIAITSQGVADVNLAKNKLTASYLAQEGVELVRNMRDTNALDENLDWNTLLADLKGCISTDGTGCNIDALNGAIKGCSPTGCQMFYDSKGFYRGSGMPPDESIFTRLIVITDLGLDPDQIKIDSTVFWTQKSGTESVTMGSIIFNWIQ